MADNVVHFDYLNHRGVTARRTVTPKGVQYLPAPGYGYKPGWFLCGYDHDKEAVRSFSFDRIMLDERELKHGVMFRVNVGVE